MKKDKEGLIGTTVFVVLALLLVIGPSRLRRVLGSVEAPWSRPLVTRDLADIRMDTLRVLVLRDALSWEQHGDEYTGLEWELLERFAKRENLIMLPVSVADPDSMLLMLQRGDGDVIAAQLCTNGWARRFVAFTVPYRSVSPLRIALKADPLLRTKHGNDKANASIDTLLLSRWSPFFGISDVLDTKTTKAVLRVDTASPEDLLVRVCIGLCTHAITTDAAGTLTSKRLPPVQFGPSLGKSVPLAFAVRTNAHGLLSALDAWLTSSKEREAREQIIASYANGPLSKGPLRGMRTLTFNADSISPYDSLFQLSAATLDWKLLAAVAFKESRFDTSALNNSGASGLMQMMPRTAASMGVGDSSGVDDHIRGAARYLSELDTLWRGSVPNVDQRLKFVLASYNAGPGHIKDAQRLAEELGVDPHRWDGCVERVVPLLIMPRCAERPCVKNGYLRGSETFWYVRDVIAAFAQFRKGDAK